MEGKCAICGKEGKIYFDCATIFDKKEKLRDGLEIETEQTILADLCWRHKKEFKKAKEKFIEKSVKQELAHLTKEAIEKCNIDHKNVRHYLERYGIDGKGEGK